MSKQKKIARWLLWIFGTWFISAPAQEAGKYSPNELLVKMRGVKPLGKAADPQTTLRDALLRVGGKHALSIQPVLPTDTESPLANVFVIRFADAVAIADLIPPLQQENTFEYVQLNHILALDGSTPNDSLFTRQWGLQAVQALSGWEISAGSPDVPVAVIDTGIDYHHPDLQGQIWLNAGEDLNHNGVVDSSDFNDVDDDGNGFVDDLRGWDFTDAPSFVDGGDYLDPDNDPFDENGHGTAVSGIIAARADNLSGIVGLAYKSRVMALRAGTSLGFLEEDDVAAATVYAVKNGARVINMSFGDIVVSPMLRDVIRYAYARGVAIVASAGNSASDEPHYPSGFAETISVGAVSENLVLSGFSNYGTTIDVVAPGQNIWSTQLHNSYSLFSGTSAAAPFVSALAAQILTQHPDWSTEQMRSVLVSSAKDLGDSNWDRFYGAGLIDAAQALQIQQVSSAVLIHPRMDAGFALATIPVVGTASGAFLQSFDLSYGTGPDPQIWQTFAQVENRQVVHDTLGWWDLRGLSDGPYTLRLRVQNQNGSSVEDFARIFVDRSPPVIFDVQITPMIEADHHSAVIAFHVDDLCQASIFWRVQDDPGAFHEIPLNYVNNEQRYNFSEQLSAGARVEFYLWAVNGAGLSTIADSEGVYYKIEFPQTPIAVLQLNEAATTIPSGLLLHRLVDLDANGRRELLIAAYGEHGNLGNLAAYEWSPAGFQTTLQTTNRAIPRDVGDSDGDGLVEVLAGLGPSSFIYEAEQPGSLPNKIVWADTNDFWAARFADLDHDGHQEIIARVLDMWQIWENSSEFNTYAFGDSLPNPTRGSNITGVPHVETGDFDGDGKMEALFGDYDGDVYIYEAEGDNRFVWTWADSLPLLDTIDFLRAGDFNGNGQTDFAVACHSDPAFNSEHEFDARHWLVRIYQGVGDNDFEVAWEQNFFGFFPPKDFDSGLGAGDLDGNGSDELVVSLFPQLYVAQFDPAQRGYQVVWHFRGAQSNTVIVGDPGDGIRSLFFNDGKQIVHFSALQSVSGPATPLDFDARPLDAYRILLDWRPVDGANFYNLYRGSSADSLQVIATVTDASAVDSSVQTGQQYFYAVSAVDSTRQPRESRLSPTVGVVAGPGPRLLAANFLVPNQLNLVFSKPLGESAKNQSSFTVAEIGHPASVILATGRRELFLTFPNLAAGSYVVQAAGLIDLDRTPLDTAYSSASFTVPPPEQRFYLVSAEILDERHVRLIFNQKVSATAAADTSHFELSAPLRLASVVRDAANANAVILQLSDASRIAALGRDYRIVVRGLSSESGLTIRPGEGDAAGFVLARKEIGRVFAFPNPFVLHQDQTVMIAGLPRVCEIRILDEFGRPIRHLKEFDGNGGTPWDGRDEHGNEVASGIYLIYVTNDSGQKTFAKVAVIR